MRVALPPLPVHTCQARFGWPAAGSVVDLAVAVVVGTAFTNLVNAVVSCFGGSGRQGLVPVVLHLRCLGRLAVLQARVAASPACCILNALHAARRSPTGSPPRWPYGSTRKPPLPT